MPKLALKLLICFSLLWYLEAHYIGVRECHAFRSYSLCDGQTCWT